jgi:predicted small metal-binding protein
VKSFACGDVVPGCDATFVGADDGAILGQVGRHAAESHGLIEEPAELIAAVTAAIRPVATV